MKEFAEFFKLDNEIKIESCEKHGEYESKNVFKSIWSGCPQCAAEKQAVQQREDEENAAQERHRVWQRKIGEAGIPERFHTRTLDSYNAITQGQVHALEFSLQYADSFSKSKGKSAIFCGKPGTGKTHLAVGIGLKLMEQKKLVLFTTVHSMFRRVKDSWRNDSAESESDVIDLLIHPDLLILDEIGVQFGTEFERNLMFDIMNKRYENRKSTLLLSNLTPIEVKNFLGERVYDRLREDGGCTVPFDWDSYRSKSA